MVAVTAQPFLEAHPPSSLFIYLQYAVFLTANTYLKIKSLLSGVYLRGENKYTCLISIVQWLFIG